jgi:hypothetical protein
MCEDDSIEKVNAIEDRIRFYAQMRRCSLQTHSFALQYKVIVRQLLYDYLEINKGSDAPLMAQCKKDEEVITTCNELV